MYLSFACDFCCKLTHEFSKKKKKSGLCHYRKWLTLSELLWWFYTFILILTYGKWLYKILDNDSLIVYSQYSYKTNIIFILLKILCVSNVSKSYRFHTALQLYLCPFRYPMFEFYMLIWEWSKLWIWVR